ncbi:MAG: hypothetical protein U0990_02050 [Candidatus Nanopelagicales bacterium]|nr:hypothetical protein [Candidatus Nanopelagicales bacterium]MDZ4248852.1 hypothetical protein [Candidatus Nanopelagicales bacterium]
MTTRRQSFDRVRPRSSEQEDQIVFVDGELRIPDSEGKRALFSSSSAPPTFGSVALTCTKCDSRSVVSWTKAIRLALPGIPALIPGTGVRVWMRCPACRDRTWVDVSC